MTKTGQHDCKKSAAHSPGRQLSDSDLEFYKNKLMELRSRLRSDVAAMADAALSQSRSEAAGDLSSVPLHMADLGTDNFEQEQTLSFIESDSATLAQIEDALSRVEKGRYGICESCGQPIPKARLNFLPYAAKCVQCVEHSRHNAK